MQSKFLDVDHFVITSLNRADWVPELVGSCRREADNIKYHESCETCRLRDRTLKKTNSKVQFGTLRLE